MYTSLINKKTNIYYYLFVLLFFLGQMIFSQESVKFEHITTQNGLSQNDVNAIYQDNKGFLWFATHDGLNKYDGYSFTVYQPNANDSLSISSNLIFDIIGDKKGNLWVGTTGSGLNYFDQLTNSFKNYKHNEENNNSLINDYIIGMLLDSKNRLWIGTQKGLDMVDLEKRETPLRFNHFTIEQSISIKSKANNINAIYEDKTGEIWVGTLHGLFTMSRDKNGEYYMNLVPKEFGFPRTTVGSITEDKYGKLLIGSSNGLFVSTDATKTKVEFVQRGFFND